MTLSDLEGHFSALRGVYSDTIQLNSTDPVEQRTSKSVVFLFMTSRLTNWVNCCSRCRVEFSWVELCRYKRAFKGFSTTMRYINRHYLYIYLRWPTHYCYFMCTADARSVSDSYVYLSHTKYRGNININVKQITEHRWLFVYKNSSNSQLPVVILPHADRNIFHASKLILTRGRSVAWSDRSHRQ